ncbi:hypothetical protein ERJ75_000699700 [Trypanosoma vivax]|nr:hypothetical protein ERJ75_000699700 [Trypanosoma vivax]
MRRRLPDARRAADTQGRRAGGLRTAALLPDAQQDRQSSARTRWCAPLAPRPVKGRVAHVRGGRRAAARRTRLWEKEKRQRKEQPGEQRCCENGRIAAGRRRGALQGCAARVGTASGGNKGSTEGKAREEMRTGLLACVAALVLVSAAKAQERHHRDDRVKDTDAATLCSLSQTLKQLARQAWREMEEAQMRQGRITEACSHAAGSEAHLAAAREANEAQRLTGIATQLCARMATATTLAQRASNAAAKLSAHSAALAGENDQWVSTMSSVVSKAGQGKFCLGSSSAVTEGSSKLQTALATALKGKTVSYANGNQGSTTVPPPACGAPLSAWIDEEESQNLAQVKAKLDFDNVTQLLTTQEAIERATSNPASTCPLTSIAQNTNAGIYREHTVAGMWTITGTPSNKLVATYKADKLDTIKKLASKLEGVSTSTENAAWNEACTIAGTNWCTETSTRQG